VFLTISTTGSAARPATDLGFLLHKHPDKAQRFSTSYGDAHVFYPEASASRCTAALLLEVDPTALARRAPGKGRGPEVGRAPDSALGRYVNDRPYAASSLLAVAIRTVLRRQALLGGARRGRQAAAHGRGLAGRPPRAGPDHEPVPGPPARADPPGGAAAGARPAGGGRRQRGRGGRQRRRRRGRHRGAAGAPGRAAARGDPGRARRGGRGPGAGPRLRTGAADRCAAEGPSLHRDRRGGRVDASARRGGPPAPPRPVERAPGGAGAAAAGLAHLHRLPAGRLRRGGAL
jgi:hypothetical protein